jgi:hypothetical protein
VFVITKKFKYICIGDVVASSLITTVLLFLILGFSIMVFDRLFEELSEKRKFTKKMFEIGLNCEIQHFPWFLVIHNLLMIVFFFVIFVIKIITLLFDLLKSIYNVMILRIAIYKFAK